MSCRFLVVDDDPFIREALRLALTKRGHEVTLASHGREALARLQETPAEVLLTDIFMPEMEGIETIQKIRRSHPQMIIIAMSGGSPMTLTVDFLQVARQFGATQVLDKPFTTDQLDAALRAAGVSS